MTEVLAAKLDNLPATPGVYLFLDQHHKVIYVGKAKQLRQRVRSYFQATRADDPKVDFLRRSANDVECIITDSEIEALLLESALVKKHQPRLNVRLKDDKAFLHVKLTVNEDYPRVFLTRRRSNDGALYFGPYLPASLARSTIKIINRHFQLRTCQIEIDGKAPRPCLEYYIKRCLGPCVAGLCGKEEYSRAVQDVVLLLEGKNEALLANLTEKMEQAAELEQFEAAAFFRDRIQLVRDLAEKQKMVIGGVDSLDVFAYYREGPRLALQLFTLREGRVVGRREFFWEDLDYFEPSRFLHDAVSQYYLNAGYLPHEACLPVEFEDQELLEALLNRSGATRGRKRFRFSVPKRGTKHNLLLLVEKNAKLAFESRFKIQRTGRLKLLESLKSELDLPRLPKRIEAFDISNIQGAEAVASMVVCENGTMKPAEYRRFRIKSVEGPDDFASIHEVVRRRYARLTSERRELPDLVLIDGGKGQLHSAYQALSQLGIDDTPVASIAKREELVFVQGQEDPLVLGRSSGVLHLLQEIRDEAHRFAVTYHRRRRSIRDFTSELDAVPGIGLKRRRRLLQNFGSIEGIRRASLEELRPFVGKKLARILKEQLREGEARATGAK